MSFDFSRIAELSTARGKLVELKNSAGRVICAVKSNVPIILEVEKITSDTYAAEFAGNFATTMSVGVEAEKGNCSVGMQLGVTKGQNDKTDTNFMAKVRYQF